MSFFDLVGELRRGLPSLPKAATAMKTLGWVCLAGGVWNWGFARLVPAEDLPLRLPEWLSWASLFGLTLLGTGFLAAARGIEERKPWGRTLGQLGILLLTALFVGFGGFVFLPALTPFFPAGTALFPAAFFALVAAQFAIPAVLGVRYLGRLPAGNAGGEEDRFGPKGMAAALQSRERRVSSAPEVAYVDALLPFGVLGSFALLLGVPLALSLTVARAAGPERLPWVVLPTLILVFVLPTLYNFVPSPFQERRRLVTSFTGGGSIYLFSGSWPFFRLLVYADGLEIRVMFHRFFVPYDRMDELPQKVGFFSRGLLVRSDLSGVPSRIRFQCLGMRKIVRLASDLQLRHKRGQAPPGGATGTQGAD